MEKRTIDFDKFQSWLLDQVKKTNKMIDDKVSKKQYQDALALYEEANTYEFLHILINEVPAELPDFVIIEEKKTRKPRKKIRVASINTPEDLAKCRKEFSEACMQHRREHGNCVGCKYRTDQNRMSSSCFESFLMEEVPE